MNEVFLPNKLMFEFGPLKIEAQRTDNIYMINQEIKEPLNCNEIVVKYGDHEIDRIPHEVKLEIDDVLAFEYKLNVQFGQEV